MLERDEEVRLNLSRRRRGGEMRCALALCTLAVVVCRGEGLEMCTEEEETEMQRNFTNCTLEFKEQYNIQVGGPLVL